ncbi:MAG: hypothetical protein NUK57_09295 [Gudongella sp.]|nr:hypothetical protein [Gudongella sp.]
MKKYMIIVGLILVLSLSFVGCSQEAPMESEPEAVEPENPEPSENESQIDEEAQIDEEPQEEPEENLLSEAYAEIMMGNRYTMKYRTITTIEGQEYEATITTAVDGDNFATVFDSDLANSTTIQKDGMLYMVMHDQKMVMVFPEDTDQAAEFDMNENEVLETDGMEYSQSGSSEFMGETRRFEEYKVEGGTIRYYFDDADLIGMEMTGPDYESTWHIEEFSDSVDMSLFDIPEDYTTFEP